MELKLILSGIIVLGGFLSGKIISDSLKLRCDDLKGLIVALAEAEGLIEASVPVNEIYKRLSGKNRVGKMFENMSCSTENDCEKLWREGLKSLYVTDEDKKPLIAFAQNLGKTLRSQQENEIKICLAAIEKNLTAAEEKYKKEGELYCKLGGCAGLLVSLFLV